MEIIQLKGMIMITADGATRKQYMQTTLINHHFNSQKDAGAINIKTLQMIHELKTWNEFLPLISTGKKTFEVRKNDRDFKPGDTLKLLGYEPRNDKYSGDQITVEVTYVLQGGQFGIEEGHCVMGI